MKFLSFLIYFSPMKKELLQQLLSISRHSLAVHPFFCPDSDTIETLFHCSLLFLSRFSYYRDTLSRLTLFSVPILTLSRHSSTARSFFCPDSNTIETYFDCSPFFCPDSDTIETLFHGSLFFLSRFCHYRDTLPPLALFSVPILPLSRHVLTHAKRSCYNNSFFIG